MNGQPDPTNFAPPAGDIPVDFLERLRPGGPWTLTAILPGPAPGEPPTNTVTARDHRAISKFVGKHDGKRNLYYSVNPTRTATGSKAPKTNIATIEFALADCDPKERETPVAAKARYREMLKTSGVPEPTAIVDSGNGLQMLWRLDKPIPLPDPVERVDKDGKPIVVLSDEAQAIVSDVEGRIKATMLKLGTEAGTQNIDRILRLPGTTNLPTKAKRERGRVECAASLVDFNDSVHPLASFPEPEPEATKVKSSAPDRGGSKREAEVVGVEELRVSERIKAIIRSGENHEGEDKTRSGAVWTVMLALAAQGYDDLQFEAIFLDAEIPISAHVLDQPNPEKSLAAQIEKARAQTGAAPGAYVLDPKHPMQSARRLAADVFSSPDGERTLHRYRGGFWRWDGAYYCDVTDEAIEALIWKFLEKAEAIGRKGAIECFKPTRATVGDVLAALAAVSHLDEHVEAPAWLTQRGARHKAAEFFPCGNGLLHLPTGKLHKPTPEFFGLSASGALFDPTAPEPREWLGLLADLFGDDLQSIELLQEFFGYSLSADTSQQKILLIAGPRRAGKGTIARVLTELVGREFGRRSNDEQPRGAVRPGAADHRSARRGIGCEDWREDR